MARIVIVALTLFFILTFAGRFLGTLASSVALPIYGIRHWISESTAPLPVFIRSRQELLDEIRALEEKISTQSGNEATIARLANEVDVYRDLLSETDTDSRIVAGIVALPPELPYDRVLIDRGRSDGVVEQAVVYHSHDRAIGVVSTVFDTSAIVTLFSSPGMEATAYIFGPDIFAHTYGEGGGIVRISVPQGVAVSIGDAVVLPGIGAGILGIVESIESIPTEPDQQAYVTLSAPLQSLYAVGVSTRVYERLSYEGAIVALSGWNYHDLNIHIPSMSTSTEPVLTSTTSPPTQ